MRNITLFHCASLVLALPLLPLNAQQPAKSLPPLQNTTRMIFQGVVKPAQTVQMPNSLNPISVPSRCQFEMKLMPGQNHVEARMVGAVRQTNNNQCEADFDVGIPTVIQPSPASLGASVATAPTTSSSTVTTAAGDVINIGQDDGNAPDLTSIFAASKTPTGSVLPELRKGQDAEPDLAKAGPRATPGFSSGYMNGIVYDPLYIQVTYVDLYVGWVWQNTGTCVTNGSYSQYLTDYSYTGWFLAYNGPTEYTNCNGVVNYTYAEFINGVFCSTLTGLNSTTYVYYWPIQVQGWQDGTLYGNFSWTLEGGCIAFLTPAYQLNRSVN